MNHLATAVEALLRAEEAQLIMMFWLWAATTFNCAVAVLLAFLRR